ncbi:hypothetical protein ACFLVV_01085 [Chloroflexota bacterium]
MKRIMAVMVLALVIVGFQAPATAADPMTMTVIDFEGLADYQIVDDYYYSTHGVIFAGAEILTAGGSLSGLYPPKSGSCVVYDYLGYADPGTMTITFSTLYTHVGGYFTANTALTFTAYDSGGNPVGQDLSLDRANYIGAGLGLDPNHYLHVDYAGGIAKVVIEDTGNDFVMDDLTFGGDVRPPANVKYLHSTDGVFNLTDPIGTQWHELWPIFCREYHLSSWNDTSGDGVLSYCDRIDMYEKPDGELRPYHVENVTITLVVTRGDMVVVDELVGNGLGKLPAAELMYIELVGGYNETALGEPIGTLWHEIYPNFCKTYNLTGVATDNGGELGYCDFIDLTDKATGEVTVCHVEEVAIDIVVTPEPPPVGGEAYPVSKASVLAPWIAVAALLAGGISWYVLRRRRDQS